MTAWTVTALPARGHLATATHADEAAARAALAELLAAGGHAAAAAAITAGATLAAADDGALYALAPAALCPPTPAETTHAQARAYVLAAALRGAGWHVRIDLHTAPDTDDAPAARTAILWARRDAVDHTARLTFTSALAAPHRSRLGRAYRTNAYDLIPLKTVRAVLAWALRATEHHRPAHPRPADAACMECGAAEGAEHDAGCRTPGPVVLVACGAAKLDRPAPAGQMYTGSYHRATRRAAAVLAGPRGRVMILSARYGLLDLDTVITPYEQRLPERQAPAEWVAMVRAQAAAAGITRPPVVLAGRAYVHGARQIWPEAAAPLEGAGGIGGQLRALAQIYGAARPDARAGSVAHDTPQDVR